MISLRQIKDDLAEAQAQGSFLRILLSLYVRHDVVNENLDQGERVKFMGKVVFQTNASSICPDKIFFVLNKLKCPVEKFQTGLKSPILLSK